MSPRDCYGDRGYHARELSRLCANLCVHLNTVARQLHSSSTVLQRDIGRAHTLMASISKNPTGILAIQAAGELTSLLQEAQEILSSILKTADRSDELSNMMTVMTQELSGVIGKAPEASVSILRTCVLEIIDMFTHAGPLLFGGLADLPDVSQNQSFSKLMVDLDQLFFRLEQIDSGNGLPLSRSIQAWTARWQIRHSSINDEEEKFNPKHN